MNKILVVGHSSSRYADVERLLVECGMKPAVPSRRDAFTPQEINAMLLKARPRVSNGDGVDVTALRQIEPHPMWQSLVLDLLLANIDQPLWGWADPQAVHLLDYWKELDPGLAFVLVYDTPTSAFNTDGGTALEERARGWVDYNQALLHFYLRNTDRSLLVHAQQVLNSSQQYLEHLRSRISAPLEPPVRILQRADELDQGHSKNAKPTATVHTASTDRRDRQMSSVALYRVRSFVAQSIIEQMPRAISLYEEMQSVASIPLEDDSSPKQRAIDAWRSLAIIEDEWQAFEKASANHEKELSNLQGQLAALELTTFELNAARASSESYASSLEHQNRELAAIKAAAEERISELEDKNADLVRRLEAQGQDSRALEERMAELRQACGELTAAKKDMGERLLRLEQAYENKASEAESLLTQLLKAQTELERYCDEIERHRDEAKRYSAEIQQLRRSLRAARKARRPKGAAKRAREHLRHRLGVALIHGKRGFLGSVRAPLAVAYESIRFLADRAKNVDEPPLSEYVDAEKAEAVIRDLPYRLGAIIIEYARNPVRWLGMPFALRREVRKFRQERTTP